MTPTVFCPRFVVYAIAFVPGKARAWSQQTDVRNTADRHKMIVIETKEIAGHPLQKALFWRSTEDMVSLTFLLFPFNIVRLNTRRFIYLAIVACFIINSLVPGCPAPGFLLSVPCL
jgi:hypothetical protein